MALDEKLNASVRAALAAHGRAVHEVKMFGGIGFMLNGNMIAAASDRGLLVRVGAEQHAKALTRRGASPMLMRGREMPGYVRVASEGLDARAVATWLRMAYDHVARLPAKPKSEPGRKKSARRSSP